MTSSTASFEARILQLPIAHVHWCTESGRQSAGRQVVIPALLVGFLEQQVNVVIALYPLAPDSLCVLWNARIRYTRRLAGRVWG